MNLLYTALLYLLSPLFVLRLYWKSLGNPAYRQHWGQRFGLLPEPPFDSCIWIHAVSVGEVQASQELVRRLRELYPGQALVISTTTPTGADRVQLLFGDKVQHYYFPYDLPISLRAWLGKVRPALLLMMETEIWPNLLQQCRREGIPTVLANARLSEKSARGYARLGSFTRRVLQSIDYVAAQSEEDAVRFQQLGIAAEKISVTGSIKFDTRTPAIVQEQAEVMRRLWGVSRPVWIAASTREGEEEIVLDAHAWLRETMPDALLVLVPRHPERFDRVAQMCEQRGFKVVRRSSGKACDEKTAVFLGDSMGELAMMYQASDLAFVGGSLVKLGGQNILEPASLGVPVLFGPYMYNFAGISQLLLQEQAAMQVGNAGELASQVQVWLSDAAERSRIGENGLRVVEANKGALDRLMQVIQQIPLQR
ncbi:MAG: lipid IV(A) 3-deoxy-D-manno-octulosonic acid transferase [Chromatiales bacterium]|jgi:3-deoxy-D-manno-octulosonic-acid transferase